MRTKFTLMCILACCVSFGLVAMPTKEETAWAEPVVLKLLESDQAALDAGKKTRGEVAAKAMQLADEADTEAAKLLLMKGAFVLYVRDGNVEKAVETMNALELAIADLPQEYVENMVELALIGQSKKEDGARLYRLLGEKECKVDVVAKRPTGDIENGRTEIGGYTWSYRVSNGEATIMAKTDGRFSCAVSPKPTGHVSIPATLDGIKVTGIGRDAFSHCGGLLSVTIPPSVTCIDDGAFSVCGGLTTVMISLNVKSINWFAFSKCTRLTSVTIPDSVTWIGGSAFSGCNELTSVTMCGERPDVGKGVFGNCDKLAAIHVPANAKSWAGMKEWQGIPLVFDAEGDARPQVAKDRATVQSIIDGMIKVPGRDYWLSETELTQGQWEAVMGYNLSSHKGANLPAENISRDDCDVFLEKLNQTREVCSSRFEFAIPMLLEWRYAAQAGGPEYDIWIKPGVVGDVLDMAWVSENSSNQTHAVATKAPNAFGFYDMLGNVWEWMYGEDPTIGCRHGFAFDDAAAECSVKRGWHKPRNLRFDHCGLRLVARVRSAGGNARESKAQAAKRPAVATESAKDHATCSDDEGCPNMSILDRLKRHGPK